MECISSVTELAKSQDKTGIVKNADIYRKQPKEGSRN